MDSGNSGSMQSSSGDDEYDSRPDSSLPSNFLNHSNHYAIPLSLNPQPFFPHQDQHPSLYDPSPNILHAFSPPSPNPNLLNLDVIRSRGVRSDPDCVDLSGNFPGSSSTPATTHLGAHGSNQASSVQPMQLRSVQDNRARSSSPNVAAARNPKKRTRASRRAPTTVLTTDTSNFRAMVQEFTGIPAPPFSGSPYSRRFDLFGSVGSGLRSSHIEPLGSFYPLRPSAQKAQHQQTPFSFSSSSSLMSNNSMLDATNIGTSTSTNNNISVTSSSSIPTGTTTGPFNPSSMNNYQLPSDLAQLSKHSHTILNMQNQMLSFQSLLQSAPPPFNVSGLGSKSQATLPSLHELGVNLQGQVNTNLSGLPSHNVTTSSSAEGNMPLRNDQNNNCKLNYTSSSSEFHHYDKVIQNVPPRGEGTVESWICPSD